MAPEILKGIAYDNKVDIWSLGVILYELVTNEKYLYGENIIQIIVKSLKNEAKPLPVHAPDDIGKLIVSMLKENPTERPTIKEVLKIFEPYLYLCINKDEIVKD